MTAVQTPACDRCTQGVMDATNDHARGLCSCACHDPWSPLFDHLHAERPRRLLELPLADFECATCGALDCHAEHASAAS